LTSALLSRGLVCFIDYNYLSKEFIMSFKLWDSWDVSSSFSFVYSENMTGKVWTKIKLNAHKFKCQLIWILVFHQIFYFFDTISPDVLQTAKHVIWWL
jgi:hypothetical protein